MLTWVICLLFAVQGFGIDLAELITTGGKELVFNEFGIGGGATAIGDTPARTEDQVSGIRGKETQPGRVYIENPDISWTAELSAATELVLVFPMNMIASYASVYV